jgi:thiol:disulfide interchange protein
MKISFLFMLSLILLFNSSFAKQPTDSVRSATEQNHKFDPARDANKDLQNAIVQAQQTHKRILLDVGGEWCIWCHRLDSLFLQYKDLAEYLNKHYVVVKINVSKENKNQEFLSKYPKVSGYPHLFVLARNGKLLHSQETGALEYPKNYPIKGHDRKKVLSFLKKWAK